MLSHLNRYKICLYILLLTIHCSLFTASKVFAAPHITRGKPEPPSKVGKHLSERMKAKKFAPMLANATTGPVDILFLRVAFKDETSVTDWSVCYSSPPVLISGDPDPDPNTNGLGVWNHPDYAQPVGSTNYDYWVNQAATRFPQYFTEVSYGLLTVNVAVSTVYTLANPMCYYGRETDADLSSLIIDSVKIATDINFALYDAVIIVHAGAGEETDKNNSKRDIWSLYYSKSCFDSDPNNNGCQPLPSLKNGAPFDEFIVMPQTGSQDGGTVDPLGIYVHEFGHWLGLPDLYYTAFPYLWDGVGQWSLMGDGIYLGSPPGSSPAHLDAWCKTYLGWVTPDTMSTFTNFPNPGDPGFATLLPVETNQRIIKLPAVNTTSSLYFLLENRQQSGFDIGLPGSGLLVWLIDDDVIAGNMANNTVNNNPLRPGVKLIEADGKNDLMTYNGDYGGDGDPFPGSSNKTLFTPYTNPASKPPFLDLAWLYLKDIAVTASNAIVTIGFAPLAPSSLAVSHNSVTLLTWSASPEPDLAKYKVYRNSAFLADTTESQYTDTTSSNGDTYTVTAVDSNGHESTKSATVTVTFATTGVSGGGGGGCFIATAAFGSYEAPYVKILREFRDSYLIADCGLRIAEYNINIPNIAGREFVSFYYIVSPPIADFIRESEILKLLVQIVLMPFIGMAAFLVKTTFLQKCIVFGVLIIGQAIIARRFHRPFRGNQIED